jgi:hypothetical protein
MARNGDSAEHYCGGTLLRNTIGTQHFRRVGGHYWDGRTLLGWEDTIGMGGHYWDTALS